MNIVCIGGTCMYTLASPFCLVPQHVTYKGFVGQVGQRISWPTEQCKDSMFNMFLV